jgi:hypothetical protein
MRNNKGLKLKTADREVSRHRSFTQQIQQASDDAPQSAAHFYNRPNKPPNEPLCFSQQPTASRFSAKRVEK